MKRNVFIYFATIFFFLNCNSVFYQPDHRNYYPPEKFNINYDNLMIPFGDETLNAWFIKATSKHIMGTIVQFHGNAQNLSSHYQSLVWLTNYGYNLFIFDYPGYGKSTGKLNRKNVRKASQRLLDFIDKNYLKEQWGERVVLYGQSLGGIILMDSVSNSLFNAHYSSIILEGTFSSYRSLAMQKVTQYWQLYPFIIPAFLFITDDGAVDQRLDQFQVETLKVVIHGEGDHVVPIEFGTRIYERLSGKKVFIRVIDGKHIDTFSRSTSFRYKMQLLELLKNTKPYLKS